MAQFSSGSGTWLVEGNRYVHSGILATRAVVTPNNNTIPVRIANASVVPMTLFKGMKIAMAESIEDVNINGITGTGSGGTVQQVKECNEGKNKCLYPKNSQNCKDRNF